MAEASSSRTPSCSDGHTTVGSREKSMSIRTNVRLALCLNPQAILLPATPNLGRAPKPPKFLSAQSLPSLPHYKLAACVSLSLRLHVSGSASTRVASSASSHCASAPVRSSHSVAFPVLDSCRAAFSLSLSVSLSVCLSLSLSQSLSLSVSLSLSLSLSLCLSLSLTVTLSPARTRYVAPTLPVPSLPGKTAQAPAFCFLSVCIQTGTMSCPSSLLALNTWLEIPAGCCTRVRAAEWRDLSEQPWALEEPRRAQAPVMQTSSPPCLHIRHQHSISRANTPACPSAPGLLELGTDTEANPTCVVVPLKAPEKGFPTIPSTFSSVHMCKICPTFIDNLDENLWSGRKPLKPCIYSLQRQPRIPD